MVPKFPEFKKLELSDRAEIENITKDFAPYSDFNFESMWSWDVSGNFKVSKLNGNLVVVLAEHFSDNPLISFLGENEINESLNILFEYLLLNPEYGTELKLVPEVVLKTIDFSKLIIEIDLSNYDYIYETNHLAHYDGNSYHSKRKFLNRFIKNYPNHQFKILDANDSEIQKQLFEVSELWVNNKSSVDESLNFKKELEAIKRFLGAKFSENFCFGVYVSEKLIGYQLFTLTKDSYAICHFGKTDTSYSGAFEFMMNQSAMTLLQKNIKFMNTEEDLGLPHLRQSKNSYRPSTFLRKYTIKKF